MIVRKCHKSETRTSYEFVKNTGPTHSIQRTGIQSNRKCWIGNTDHEPDDIKVNCPQISTQEASA